MPSARIVSLALAAFAVASAETPRPSPPFSILPPGKGAAPIPLSHYRGKIVVVAFIDTACPHCQELTRTLIPIAREYSARGVQVLACAFNDDAEHLVAGFVDQFHPGFPVGWSNRMAVLSYLQYTIISPMHYVPHMVFLDRRGIIRGDYPGESDFLKDPKTNIRKELDKMLKGSQTAAPTTIK